MCNDFKKRFFETNMLNVFIKGIYETPDPFAELWRQRHFCMFFLQSPISCFFLQEDIHNIYRSA